MKDEIAKTWKHEKPRLIAWMSSRIGTEDAEDALQDVIARTVANLDSLECMRDITAWFWRGARNAVVDAWRRRSRKNTHEQTLPDEFDALIDCAGVTPADEYEAKELLSALHDAIGLLPAEQSEVIIAQALNEESFASISSRTGISIDTLAARKRYGLAKLKVALALYREED